MIDCSGAVDCGGRLDELVEELVSGSVVSIRVSPDIREPSDWLAWRLIPEAFAGLCVP